MLRILVAGVARRSNDNGSSLLRLARHSSWLRVGSIVQDVRRRTMVNQCHHDRVHLSWVKFLLPSFSLFTS